MQIKTTVRYYFTLVRMAIIKKSTTINAGEGREKGTILHCWWECKLAQPLRTTVWKFLLKAKIRATIRHRNLRHIPRENYHLKECMDPSVHSSTIYNSQDVEAT